ESFTAVLGGGGIGLSRLSHVCEVVEGPRTSTLRLAGASGGPPLPQAHPCPCPSDHKGGDCQPQLAEPRGAAARDREDEASDQYQTTADEARRSLAQITKADQVSLQRAGNQGNADEGSYYDGGDISKRPLQHHGRIEDEEEGHHVDDGTQTHGLQAHPHGRCLCDRG